MNSFKSLKFISLFLLLLACDKPLPDLQGIDLQAWKDDKNACAGKRQSMVKAIDAERKKLLSLTELQVVSLLGKPDQNELYKRNQKFYTYFLEPSPACAQPSADARKLIVRFNAMGLAKEVTIE